MSVVPDQEWQLRSSIAELLGRAQSKGVQLWSDKGELRYRAPKGALTAAELEQLKACRREMVAFLELVGNHQPAEPQLEPRRWIGRIPLTFPQLSYWRDARLHERPTVRQLASALRLRGSVQAPLLQQSLDRLVARHEALRTRIVAVDGLPMQVVDAHGACALDVRDLTGLAQPAQEAEVLRQIDELILEPIQLSVGPLLGVRLLRLGSSQHVLIVVMEHMISDAFSLNLLLSELLHIYARALRQQEPQLPTVEIQFCDYAVWRSRSHPYWLQKHGRYWQERLAGGERVRFPDGLIDGVAGVRGWGTVPVKIGKEQRRRLQEWCRAQRTTLVVSVFTVFVAVVLRWCRARSIVMRYQTDGRTHPDVRTTIGYFAFILHLRLDLQPSDSFIDLLGKITREYCNAYDHADFGYVDSQQPRPAFVGNSAFNWVPCESTASSDSDSTTSGSLEASPIVFAHPVLRIYERDGEPSMLLYDMEDEIVGGVNFSLARFSRENVERFVSSFFVFLDVLLSRPEQRIHEVPLR